jgi:hypothetical protein
MNAVCTLISYFFNTISILLLTSHLQTDFRYVLPWNFVWIFHLFHAKPISLLYDHHKLLTMPCLVGVPLMASHSY